MNYSQLQYLIQSSDIVNNVNVHDHSYGNSSQFHNVMKSSNLI